MGKRRVLCIDDSPAMLRTLFANLREVYDVDMATSYEQGKFHLEKHKPDVILLDCEMPECDGKQTFRNIKAVDDYKNIPIIFLTSVSDKDYIDSIMELGPDGYLLKPAPGEKVLAAIKEVII